MATLDLDRFTTALRSTAVISAPVHRMLWRHALSTDDRALAVQLIARPDAPADLVAGYADLSDPEYRAAFLGRPDAAAHHAYTGPRTATALVAALRTSGHSGAVLAPAMEHQRDHGTLTLGRELLKVPAEGRSSDLAETLTGWCGRLGGETLLSSLFGLIPHLPYLTVAAAGRALDAAASAPLVGVLLLHSPHVPAAAALRALRTVGAESAAAAARYDPAAVAAPDRVRTGLLLRGIEAAVGRGDLDDAAAHDALAGDLTPEEYARVRSASRPAVTMHRQTYHLVASPPPTPAARDDVDTLPHLAASADPADHEIVVDHLTAAARQMRDSLNTTGSASVPMWFERAVRTLLLCSSSPQLRARTLEAISTVEWASGDRAVLGAYARWPEDTALRDTACRLWPAATLNQLGWGAFEEQQPREAWLTRWAGDLPSRGIPGRDALHIALSLGLTADQLLLVPWPILADARTHETASSLTLLDVLGDVLGEDTGNWELFTVVSRDFDGTLGDLLDVCRAATTV